jgi:serine phosphatase RsbU (regulator of sigma subunit)
VPSLHWTSPSSGAEHFRVEKDSITIGRHRECDLVLPMGFVSMHHARITRREDGWFVDDLNSTNGSFVNGQLAQHARIREGDCLRLGSLEIRFTESAGATPNQERPRPEPGPTDIFSPQTEAFATLAKLGPGEATELEKLSLLLDLQAKWGEGFSADETLGRILESSLRVGGAERACILLRGDDGFRYAAGLDNRGQVLAETNFQASRSVVARVVDTGEAVFMTQGIEGDLSEQKSIVAMNLRAVGCLPLERGDGSGRSPLGILYLDSTAPMHTLSGLDERILRKLAAEAQAVVERMELLAAREHRRTIERELELARQTQEGLLPRHIPDLDGWRLDAFCRPTRQVGGDFYDFIPLPDGRLATMIADVSGKGVAASLVSSSVQGALHMVLREGGPMHEALRRVNDYLCERSEEGRFVTLFVGILSTNGELHWTNSGHNPAYVYRHARDEIEELAATGTILGTLPSDTFPVAAEERQTRLEENDVVLVYSDGLTEATGPGEELFGEARLRGILSDHASAGVADLRAEILAAVERFTRGEEQSDDITLLLAGRQDERSKS